MKSHDSTMSVRIYSAEKSIAIASSTGNKIGLDIAVEALRAYRERTPKPNRAALTRFAQINRVQKIVRPYLEAYCERPKAPKKSGPMRFVRCGTNCGLT
jgi:hypothetical protein